MRRPILGTLSGCVLALTLTGCGGGGDAYVGEDAEQVEIGETITTEIADGSGTTGDLEVTLTGIEEGAAADLEALSSPPAVGDRTPYYLTYEFVNVDGVTPASILGIEAGLTPDGEAVQNASILEEFEPCPNPLLEDDFNEAGATYTICVVALPDSGDTVTGGNFIPESGGIEDTFVWQ